MDLAQRLNELTTQNLRPATVPGTTSLKEIDSQWWEDLRDTFGEGEICVAAILLIYWLSPTEFPVRLKGPKKKAGHKYLDLFCIGSNGLDAETSWDRLLIVLAPEAARDLMYPGHPCVFFFGNQVRAILNRAGTQRPPWVDDLEFCSYVQDILEKTEVATEMAVETDEPLFQAHLRTRFLLETHRQDVAVICSYLKRHTIRTGWGMWHLLGPRPVLYPLAKMLIMDLIAREDRWNECRKEKRAEQHNFWRGLLDLPKGANTNLW